MTYKLDTKLLVENFPTKHDAGFLEEEIQKVLEIVEDLGVEFNTELFQGSLRGITCAVINERIVIYAHDLELALRCGMRGYGITVNEWD